MTKWTQNEAIDLARKVESVAPGFGCHVALTGGCLYKNGVRKDCDLVFYRIRQCESIDTIGLLNELRSIGIVLPGDDNERFVHNGSYRGKSVDLLFPEVKSGEYPLRSDSLGF